MKERIFQIFQRKFLKISEDNEVILRDVTHEDRTSIVRLHLITVFCLMGSFFGAYALFLDFHDRGPLGQGPALGRLSQKEESVRRKQSRSLLWSNIEEGDPFYSKDSVKTGPESTAILQLNSGNRLEIAENSLVVMEELSELPLRFIQGSGVLYRKDQKAQRLLPNRVSESLPVSLRLPESLAVRLVDEKKLRDIRFGWQWQSEVKSHHANPDFVIRKRGGKTLTYSTNSDEIQLSLGEGIYEWFLKGYPEKRRLQIIQIISPRLLYPSLTQPLLQEELKKGIGAFRWIFNPHSFPKQIVATLEVSSHPHFESSTQSWKINPEHELAQISFEKESLLYWRIRLSTPGFEIVSKTTSFLASPETQLLESQPVRVGPISLFSPSPSPSPSQLKPLNSLEAVLDLKPPPHFIFKEIRQEAFLSWKKGSSEGSYEVILYEKKKKWVKILHQKMKENRLDLRSLKPGLYSWSVRAIGDSGKTGPFSPFRAFRVIFDTPLSAPEVVTPEIQ